MASQNVPDVWVIVKITPISSGKREQPLFKVLAGWYGGYARGDSWKINSGICAYSENDGEVVFQGDSGSTYHCRIDFERTSNLTASILNWLIESTEREQTAEVSLVSYEEFKQQFQSTKE